MDTTGASSGLTTASTTAGAVATGAPEGGAAGAGCTGLGLGLGFGFGFTSGRQGGRAICASLGTSGVGIALLGSVSAAGGADSGGDGGGVSATVSGLRPACARSPTAALWRTNKIPHSAADTARHRHGPPRQSP